MWIEVLSRNGEVAARERIDTQEARIGRAFDNDVVIDDPHVAPHHLRIIRGEDGELVAEDLGTLNGLSPSTAPSASRACRWRRSPEFASGARSCACTTQHTPSPPRESSRRRARTPAGPRASESHSSSCCSRCPG